MREILLTLIVILFVFVAGYSSEIIFFIPNSFGIRKLIIFAYAALSVFYLFRGWMKYRSGKLAQFMFLICASAFTFFNFCQIYVEYLAHGDR